MFVIYASERFVEDPLLIHYNWKMMRNIRYPNGIRKQSETNSAKAPRANDNHGGRGAHLEEDLNLSNQYYNENEIALIYKKPTPVQVVRVDYPRRDRARITEAYYRTPSTTDYNGLYKGCYIDFEAKETRHKTSFPDYLVHPHQILHLKRVKKQGGIGFFIIRFSTLSETYLVDALDLIAQLEDPNVQSIPHQWFLENGLLLEEGYMPRINYLKAVDQLYMKGDQKNGKR